MLVWTRQQFLFVSKESAVRKLKDYVNQIFVEGRQYLDLVHSANEAVGDVRRKEEGEVSKIDFRKAYNHIDWDLLDFVRLKKGDLGVDGGSGSWVFSFSELFGHD